MRAADVMTHNTITVDPAMPIQQLAALLSERGISGAPVVNATGNMVGIVSEGDLLHRAELVRSVAMPAGIHGGWNIMPLVRRRTT